MTVGDAATRGDKPAGGCCKLLECGVTIDKAGTGDATGMDHAGLKLGELDQRGLDAVLDGANLGCDFVCGVFNLMLAHDCSFPREQDRADVVAEMIRNVVP